MPCTRPHIIKQWWPIHWRICASPRLNKIGSIENMLNGHIRLLHSWSASQVVGHYNVNPKYGDYHGTWAQAKEHFDKGWIEVCFISCNTFACIADVKERNSQSSFLHYNIRKNIPDEFFFSYPKRYCALWDQRHSRSTHSPCIGHYTPRTLTYPSGPFMPQFSQCTVTQ